MGTTPPVPSSSVPLSKSSNRSTLPLSARLSKPWRNEAHGQTWTRPWKIWQHYGKNRPSNQRNMISSVDLSDLVATASINCQIFQGLVQVCPWASFLQGLDKRADSGRVDLLLLFDNGAEELGTGGTVPMAFFIVPQISISMDASTAFQLQALLL